VRGRGLGRLCGCGLVFVLAICGAVAETVSGEQTGQKRSARWVESIPSSGTVRVRNAHGNVYARFGGYEDQVELLATTQRLESDLPELEVELRHGEAWLDVTVRFTDAASVPGPTRDRIDLVVFVPRGATLDVETRDGLIEAKKLQGDVIAASISGDVRLRSIGGSVQVKTMRGKIVVSLAANATRRPQTLVTETGEIEVWVAEDASFEVELSTSGEIGTDFSIDIEHHRDIEPSKLAVATIGQGGPVLRVRSKKGRIRLLRLQKNFSTVR